MWLQIPEVDIATSHVVRSRIDEHIKQEASNVLAGIGLSVSYTILILLSRITAEKVLTFEVNR
ncbi:type II toxin-antitoxin system RelB/DinJ family antitoxin [Enterobacter sichuanensis]|nr:type II toxin-antitoxin system RelB/DinJ family antitoxin [Enterobacter sichuanensis]MCM7886572.1 type II toxin-antitoxin system RelB/DinJ family antitoxin [Enterobacter sichuanensis]